MKSHGGIQYPMSFVEEHVSLIKEPEKSVLNSLDENDICNKDLDLSCDETNGNTGC